MHLHCADQRHFVCSAIDRLEGELMSELENARLVRLLTKFNFINERPEFARDARWSETGDRYIIKLFRDHVFHQVDRQGKPVIDLTHVLSCLNKLDAGTEERILLVSRDEQSVLVVSYKDVKACVEAAFAYVPFSVSSFLRVLMMMCFAASSPVVEGAGFRLSRWTLSLSLHVSLRAFSPSRRPGK